MTEAAYIEAVRGDGRALIGAVTAAPGAPVTACPGWDNAALGAHTGMVWAMATNLLLTKPAEFVRPGPEAQAPDDSNAVGGWLNERLDALVAALDATPPDTPMWTWNGQDTAAFFHRRMAMETAVHRWDAQAAAGSPQPVQRWVAVDGIDEITEVGWRHRLSRTVPAPPDGSLHLHCTDGDGEWLFRTEDGSIVATHEHAKGDAAVRGAASDLFLYLWGRVDDDDVEVIGQVDVAHAWRALAP